MKLAKSTRRSTSRFARWLRSRDAKNALQYGAAFTIGQLLCFLPVSCIIVGLYRQADFHLRAMLHFGAPDRELSPQVSRLSTGLFRCRWRIKYPSPCSEALARFVPCAAQNLS
jgi:hypothetical protein